MRVWALVLALSLLGCGKSKPGEVTGAPPAADVVAAIDASVAGTAAAPDAAADAAGAPKGGQGDATADAGAVSDAWVGGADAQPKTPPEALSAFAELRKTPQTLHYLVNGQAVACQLNDAGIAGSDVDIKVTCSPTDVAWSCVKDGYFDVGDARAAPAFWRSEGCYAARGDGLWYFETCPGDKAAFDDPAAAKGVRMLSANMLVNTKPAGGEAEGAQVKGGTLALGDRKFATICSAKSVSGMMKTAERTHCMAPSYGYVAADARLSEMEATACHDWSRLEAVSEGLVPPAPCLAQKRFVGEWRWATRVEVAKDPKLVGVQGQYRATIQLAAECKLEAKVEKVGIEGRDFVPERVQRGTSVGLIGCGDPAIGELCLQLPVHLEDEGKVGFDARFVLAEREGKLSGVFRYEGKELASKVAGLLQGRAGNAARERETFDAGAAPAEALCLLKACTGKAKKGGLLAYSCDDLDAFAQCMSSAEP